MGKSIQFKIILLFLLLGVFFTSCKKDTGNQNKKVLVIDTIKLIDTTKLMGISDTGSANIGAIMVPAMLNDTAKIRLLKKSNPIVLQNQHDVVINEIQTPYIILINCSNITVKNCSIGPSKKYGIGLQECTNITVDSCSLYKVATGIMAIDSKTISIINCQAKNMVGPFPAGQFVQFKNISGPGSRISFNKFENILGESYPEDAISLYQTYGTATDPIVVESNWIRGGGPSKSGGGIMLGDGGGAYQVAKNNILVDVGQYGMAVSGGTFMYIFNNTIYGKSQPFTDVGVYYWNQTKLPSANTMISRNAINYTDSKGELANTMVLLGAGEQTPSGWATNIYDAGVSDAILPVNIIYGVILTGN